MALAPGTRLGPYEILSLLGVGGMGEVYRARDTSLKRDVAIKIVPVTFSNDSDRLQRFEIEAEAVAALNHPNILSIFYIGRQDGIRYLVAELLQGETLRQHLENGPLRLRKTVDIAAGVARGLAAAHEAGIVHRDLKPENLFVTREGQVKILDFGLAKLRKPQTIGDEQTATQRVQTAAGQVLGTVGYMSPEQVRGEAVDHRADIFAFGTILYEMLSARRAFEKPTSAETMAAILNEEPPAISQISPQVPPALERAVRRCLEKNPEQRFQSASDLAFALETLSDTGTSSGLVMPASPGRSWRTVSIVCLTLVIAGLVVWWSLPRGVPVIGAVTQLTDDGVPKQGQLVTDGTRIYFNEGATGSWNLAEVAVTGGKTAVIPLSLREPQIAGLSPDASSLLVQTGGFLEPIHPLWMIPLPAGEPRRLADIEARGASFFPDGRLVFARGAEVYIADPDGSKVRKLLTASHTIRCPNVSPDGQSIVLNTRFDGDVAMSLGQTSRDGSSLIPIVRPAEDLYLSCAVWTRDGRYLLYETEGANFGDIWAFPAQSGLFHRSRQPMQLTHGPLSYSGAVSSPDGKRLFAIGTKRRGELVRYDMKLKQFVPFLSGISAIDAIFSHDGKWVAYVSYPEHSLWRSRADGTDRLQLTYPPIEAAFPSMSPDGKQVSFGTMRDEIYVVGMDGGAPRKIAEKVAPVSSWSPDGNSLVLTVPVAAKPGEKNIRELKTYELRTGELSVVPGSRGFNGGTWIANDTVLAATEDLSKLFTFNFKTKKWTELASGIIADYAVSPDRKYAYYSAGGAEPKAMRVGLTDRKPQEITTLNGLRRVVDPVGLGTTLGVAPDGSPIFTRDIGTQEIYALDVKLP